MTTRPTLQHALRFVQCHHVVLLLILLLLPPVGTAVYLATSGRLAEAMHGAWTTLNYFIGYDTGFGGRKLIGTLCHMIWGDGMGMQQAAIVAAGGTAALALLFGLFLWRTLPRIDATTLPLAAVLMVYLLSPVSLLRYLSGRPATALFCMETYQLGLVLLWLMTYRRCRGTAFYYVATLATAILGLLIHHTFACTLLPLYVALAYHDVSCNGLTLQRAVGYGVAAVAVAATFIALWTGSQMNADPTSLGASLEERTGVDKEMLQLMYFDSNAANRHWAFATAGTSSKILDFAFMAVLMLPIVAVLWYPLMGHKYGLYPPR